MNIQLLSMESVIKDKKLSVLGAFALSIGTAIGWGSFVVTGSDFVSKAGPLGSIIGLIIGMLIMIVVAYNYHYMMKRYPDTNGGIYSFAKYTIGSDHAFLVSWFLIITYSAILWANAYSFSLFAGCVSRFCFDGKNIFEFGFSYSIGGLDVWLGEILLCAFFVFLLGGICLLNKGITTKIQFGLVSLFIAIIIAGFIIAAIMHQGGIQSYEPHFSKSGENEFLQIFRVITMSPWAFIGFENISHSSHNFKFSHNKVFKIFLASIIISAVIYISMCMLCISAFPSENSDWYAYLQTIKKPNEFGPITDIPAFYVIHHYIGVPGVVMFVLALFAIIATSIIGNIYGLAGLISTMARNGMLPKVLAQKDKNDNHVNAIIFIVSLTFIMTFFDRLLISWIVDVNNICGVIVYGYISVIAIYQARKDQNKLARTMGLIGLIVGIIFALTIIIQSVMSVDWIAPESIFVFFVWAVLGFGYYAFILSRDKKKIFGHSMAPTFGLYAIIIYSIASWCALVVKTYNSTDLTIMAIITCAVIAILTQVFFFIVFYIMTKREKDMQNKLVLGMATMVEGRDNSTGGHIKRTSTVVAFIVEEINKDPSYHLENHFASNLIKAAPMHDLGKITVDDIVLRKPGKFTPEEYAIMKTHSEEGAKIVKNILDEYGDEDFERIAENVAHYHHERWDGNGYPKGLKGEEIPLEARIMAIADVYDALVSKRVYKDEFSFEDANKIIIDGMGKQFDPGLEKYYLLAREKIEKYYQENK